MIKITCTAAGVAAQNSQHDPGAEEDVQGPAALQLS